MSNTVESGGIGSNFNWNEYDEIIAKRDMNVVLDAAEMQSFMRCTCETPFFITTSDHKVYCQFCKRAPMPLLTDGTHNRSAMNFLRADPT